MSPTEGYPRVSTLFARHSYAGRLRAAYRSYRATPHRGLTGPLVLASAIAVGGHLVATRAELGDHLTVAGRGGSLVAAEPRRDLRLEALLGEAVVRDRSSATSSFFARRALDRAARSDTRVAVPGARPAAPARAAAAPKVRKVAPPRKARWTRPSGGPLTSPYGPRWGRMHRGLDFGASHGSPVRAAFDGVVTFAGFDGGGYGKQIRIRHAGGIVTTYSHLSRISVSGGRVKAGEVIGKVGSTGNSTGPHLHFEVLVGGANVNPRSFLRAHGVRV